MTIDKAAIRIRELSLIDLVATNLLEEILEELYDEGVMKALRMDIRANRRMK